MSKITEEQAIKLGESKFWENMTPVEIAKFQMEVELSCVPFEIFMSSLSKALGRPVYVHELAFGNWKNVKAELWGEKAAPSLDEIIGLVPEEQRILLLT